MTTTPHKPSAPPRVFLRPAPTVAAVAACFGSSLFDSIQPSQHLPSPVQGHYDRRSVRLEETFQNNQVAVVIGPDATGVRGKTLSFGRAALNPSMASTLCPTVGLKSLDWYGSHPRRHPHMKLGVVGVVCDGDGRMLITRRMNRMRSFPGAWVFPGGGVEANETVADGLRREVWEETGVEVNMETVTPLCLWESVYPTTTEECVRTGQGITAHYLVLYCLALAENVRPTVRVQEEEVDKAAWLTREEVRKVISGLLGGVVGDIQTSDGMSVPLNDLAGIYPRGDRKGMAQGSLFVLDEILCEDYGKFFR